MSEPVDRKTIQDALIYGHPPLYTHPAPAAASLRDMTEADFDKAHGIAPAGVPDVASVALEEFTEWLCREMPSGTIIGEPKWWAPRIFRAAHPAQAPASLRDMTEADFDKAHGIPPAGVHDVAGLTHKLLYWARSSAENRPQAADAMREAADALAALQSRNTELRDKVERVLHEKKQQAERINEMEAQQHADTITISRLLDSVKYLRGIAERGTKREQREDETVEAFVLGYVKELESRLQTRMEREAEARAKLATAVGLLERCIAACEVVPASVRNGEHIALPDQIRKAIAKAREVLK